MCFLLQQANTNKYTLIIILYYYFMIDPQKYAYVLHCYTCYNVTKYASEGIVDGGSLKTSACLM